MTFRALKATLTPFSGVRRLGSSLGPSGLGVVTLKQGPDGIAFVGRLLERALKEITGIDPDIVALDPARNGHVSRAEKLRFATRLAQRQVGGFPEWWLFNHLGIARVQNYLPGHTRKPYGIFLMGIEAWNPSLNEDRKKCLSDATTLIAISNHTARRVREAHPTLHQIRTCHLALLPEEEKGEPDAQILDRISRLSVMIVGRMSASERYKGHDQLLECWSRVLERVPEAQLVIVGKGDDTDRLKSKAKSAGIAGSVFFTGYVSEATLEAIRRKAALFAMPSRNEGFGLVYLEAMRSGLPCIGSNVDAACEIISDGETGRLVNPDSKEHLAGLIGNLLTNDVRRRAMGEAGRRRFHESFTFEHFVERLKPILTEAFTSRDINR